MSVVTGVAGVTDRSVGEYPLEITHDHLIIRVDGGRALIDTGSPVSIGRGKQLVLEGRTWQPGSANESVLDAVRDHLGVDVDWLIGHDILHAHPMLLDWRAQKAWIGGAETKRDAATFPIELVMGVPIIGASFQGRPVRAVLDSGAALSYAPRHAVDDARESEAYRDFYPGVGVFDTPTWRVSVTLGERELELRAGVLPETLQTLFALLLGPDGWIIGSDFFRDRAILLDYAGGRVLDVTDGKESENR
jgi:hypothetical protein